MAARVEVVDIETGEVVRTLTYTNERMAEYVERGMSMKLDHERYFTRLVVEEETE